MGHGHAVVIGGSMAGMCGAKALSPFFERVTVLDRDAYPDAVGERAGVPQARHVHALLSRGASALSELFPGFRARMLERGAHDIDVAEEFGILRKLGWQERQRSGVMLLLASRALTEFVVRELTRETPNIALRERTEVTGLKLAPGDLRQVVGVAVRSRGGREAPGGAEGSGNENESEGEAPDEIEADLIVDASGRGSKAPSWLTAAGAEAPEEDVVDCFAGYSSRWYNAPPEERWPEAWWWKGLWIEASPPDKLLGGVLFPIEGERWIVTLIGYSKQYPPSDEEGFNAALGRLRSPAIARAVELAEPISPVYSNRALANRLRRYERLAAPLGGFVAIGDGVCVMNPNYGQGMSTAALSALSLAASLRDSTVGLGAGFSRAFFRAQARRLADAWEIATGGDFSYPGTVGQPPPGFSVIARYADAVFDAMRTDPVALRDAMEVLHLLRPRTALFSPSLIARVLGRSLRGLASREAKTAAIPEMPPAA